MFTIIKFPNSTTAKIVKAGNNNYLTNNLDKKLIVQVKNKTKHVDDFQHFQT